MEQLIGGFDWSSTPVGPARGWSPTLRMMVQQMLANRFPLLLWWGPQYISIYNDAYIPILGAKHPWALGRPVSECWSEIWDVLRPLIDTPYLGGPATWNDDLQLEIKRHGFLEETHFTVAYSAVPDETAAGGVGGVLATVHEITAKVVAERRVMVLRDLSGGTGASTAEVACSTAAQTLLRHELDVPFALIYLFDGNGARLAAQAGLGRVSASLAAVPLQRDEAAWPFGAVQRSGAAELVEQLDRRFDRVPPGPWADPPRQALVLPMRATAPQELAGFLVAGVSSRLQFDAAYHSFLELVAGQIATVIANARAREEEQRRIQALAELDRAKTAFFSSVSHEFRTPLTLMLGPLGDLLRGSHGALPEPALAPLQTTHRNARRLLRLVNTLLDFWRVEAGRNDADYRRTDLAALTAGVASNFRSACERAGLQLRVDCPALPAERAVYVDRDMWEKIVLNLLSNAVKFTLQGGIEVRLEDGADEGARLSVRDTGIGIAAAELPRLFQRFYRVENRHARTYEGTGIGLALVQELVKLHGGVIAVSSVPEEGSVFTVTIPYGTAHLDPQRIERHAAQRPPAGAASAFVDEALGWLPGETADAAAPEPPSLPERRQRPRVLWADDNSDMREYVARLLRPRFEVQAVADGRAALLAARERCPDLILSDVMMPGLDGFGLLREVRADERLKAVPLILISARAGEESRIEGLDRGADDYLVKPFSAQELIARVESQVRMSQLRRQTETALREAHARAEESNRRLRQADQRKNEFLALLGHELRNPLAPISNMSELLSRSLPVESPARAGVEMIRRQARQLARLVEDLLDVARITQGRIELRREAVDLGAVVAAGIETVGPLLQEKRHRIAVRSGGGRFYVHGDAARLAQCVSNLVTNSAKYTDAGGSIEVELRSDGADAVVAVSDDGCGIPASLLPGIFDLFVQGACTLDRAQGGLGIGLSVVKKLIEMHGGSVSARSEGPGRGACFELRLPLAPPLEAAPAPAPPRPRGKRVFIVDDNEDAALAMTALLESEGHVVRAVHTARDALRQLESFAPDVALIDIGLPLMNGYELGRRLRGMPALAGLKIIAVTGYGQPEDRREALEAGFDEHLVKPVADAALAEALLRL
ncbi:MAG TPA: ATP-binding protein [Nevskia sp.]|nr:ATP-binding protein [Nevskia sp.]